MKFNPLQLLTIGFALPSLTVGTVRRGPAQKNIPVAEMKGEYTINKDSGEITFVDSHGDFEEAFSCSQYSGLQLTFNKDNTFAACYALGQELYGSPDTAFDCCGGGHQIAGSPEVGYRCCPTVQAYDGAKCGPADQICKNGKTLVNGSCACPPGTAEDALGACKVTNKRRAACNSGVSEGKCYAFKMENGHLLGYDNNGYYTAAEDSNAHIFGKFQFCKTEKCDGTSAINPEDNFHIRDIHGQANSGGHANEWLNSATDAGEFSITKWTCGKHCLTGFQHGLGPTCPSTTPAITFNTLDKQACRPLDLIEIPCDVRAKANNCIWSNTPESCGPIDSNYCKCK